VDEFNLSPELMAALQKSKLLDDLYANPKTKGRLLEITKEQRPDLSVPEIDVRNAIAPEMEELRRTNQELRAEMTRTELKRRHDMDDEELKATAQLMQQEKIGSFDTAVELRKYRSASPRNTPSNPIQLPDATELFRNPSQWARNEAYKTIAEFRRGRQ